MLITIVLMITATYAWFSTQKDVEITGMRLNVEVAESMQISLDGEIWAQSIVIKDMKQFYGTYTGTGDTVAIYQAKKPDNGGNQNYVPKELLPVSSSGTVTAGKLQFVQGKVYTGANGKIGLKEITTCSETDLTPTATIGTREGNNASHPFLVFDMYLRNISAKAEGEIDILKLNKDSRVWVNTASTTDKEGAGKAGTGLEYSARVGFVPYNNTISATALESGGKTVGQQVREITAKGDEKVAIWEPNDLEHTPYVVSNNDMGITQTAQSVTTYAIKNTVGGTTTDIDDVYDTTDEANLASPITMKPAYNLNTGTTTIANLTATDGTTTLGLKPNTITKVRVYIWLEGQDPDCVDLASTGDKLNIDLKLTKDSKGVYKTGLYVKDQITGIGTLTYIDPNTKIFGALGHEIIEYSSNIKIEVKDGKIFGASITGITKSTDNSTGEKNAKFNESITYGTITENTISGIFGEYLSDFDEARLKKVANPDEIVLGPAKILTVLEDNNIEEFGINVLKVNRDGLTKNILFEITDEKLKNKTNGIIKGMSGSPIIQDDKIIGAVTHAIVNDNNKGYGIFITTMLEEGEN